MTLLSEQNPSAAENAIRNPHFGPSIDNIVDSLWDQSVVAYFSNPPMYTAALLVGGVCAESAHRFYCEKKKVSQSLLKGKWEDLINYSISQKLLPDPSIGRILHLIRKDYRNPWVHIDLDKITEKIPSTGLDKKLNAMIFSQKVALNCLWLTAAELSAFYGSKPPIMELSNL